MLPTHVVIIPDGNRRWAILHKKSLLEGYKAGMEKITELIKWCVDLKIKTLTLWGFSTENFYRDANEINSLMKLFKIKLDEGLKSDVFHKNKIRLRFIGKKELFSPQIQKKMGELEELTKTYTQHHLNILMGYGGRREIIDACNSILSDFKKGKINKVTEEVFSSYLTTNGLPDPDLIIRTSGEQRLSGLFPWQGVYAELYFSKKLWPDFTKNDLIRALRDFEHRKRRFGK